MFIFFFITHLLRKVNGSYTVSPVVIASGLQGWSEFSEGTSAKWIFDVEIEELRAKILCKYLEDQSRAWCFLDTTS
jgi:hypothetical protein